MGAGWLNKSQSGAMRCKGRCGAGPARITPVAGRDCDRYRYCNCTLPLTLTLTSALPASTGRDSWSLDEAFARIA